MVDTPANTQKLSGLKRVILAPFPHIVPRWALRPPKSKLKAVALRRLVVPQLRADSRYFEKLLDNGSLFCGNTRDMLPLYVYIFGIWEPNLTSFISARLGPGDVFIDVGANLGWFSILAASLVADSGEVVAIEASPLLSRELDNNVDRNGFENIDTINAAAGSHPRTVDIVHGPAEHTGVTRIVQGSAVRCDTLPALVGIPRLSRARVIKIDVEGAEYEVIKGLAPALAGLPNFAEVVVEVGPERAQSQVDVSDLFMSFERSGFFPYALPNRYEVDSYLLDPPIVSLERMSELPVKETDVVFSRHDLEALPIEPAHR